MDKKVSNPSAFPEIYTDEEWSETHNNFKRDTYSCGGMTLRDYFAGQALSGLCVMAIPGSHNSCANMIEEQVPTAYKIADAMLLEREKTNERVA